MKDRFGREISYMRISITDKCNLRCTYCMGEDSHDDSDNQKPECLKRTGNQKPECLLGSGNRELSVDEIAEIVEAAVECGIHKIRITGGEPLVRPDVVEICRRIHAIEGVEELTLTTNGIFLEKYAGPLKEAGVSRLNISLDTLDAEKYRSITQRGNIQAVLRGIEAAREVGLLPIKINVVLLKDFNEDEIKSFVNLTKNQPIEVRFIELMPIGAGIEQGAEHYLKGEVVLEKVPELMPAEESGVAKLYRLPNGVGKVGLIRPVSRHFCPSCNRIRLTSDGLLKPCLHFEEEIDIRHLHGVELKLALEQAILRKPMEHEDFTGDKVSRSARDMYQIGG